MTTRRQQCAGRAAVTPMLPSALPWEYQGTSDAAHLPVLPCRGGGIERAAQHRSNNQRQRRGETSSAAPAAISTATSRREILRNRRLIALREQLRVLNKQFLGPPAAAGRPSRSDADAVATPDGAAASFRPVAEHFKIPHGLWLREATSVAVDSQDRVYVFNRGNMPVMVFDVDGNVSASTSRRRRRR